MHMWGIDLAVWAPTTSSTWAICSPAAAAVVQGPVGQPFMSQQRSAIRACDPSHKAPWPEMNQQPPVQTAAAAAAAVVVCHCVYENTGPPAWLHDACSSPWATDPHRHQRGFTMRVPLHGPLTPTDTSVASRCVFLSMGH
ncbi:hypothetical protein CgunFtcFv8_020178 [Champsocephalus gunnari]|uniref:Secreted protein n=1 Tax=Champsocephalus gunnari TaxID=52237 RepID=A0AAN8HSY3_CHAGU|nr:hypothetical protein CgunFtcFv8_020178 [Champsocephalus gunnari]